MKVFVEEQQITQYWIHLLLTISLILPIVLVSKELIEFGWENKEARTGFIITLGSIILVYILIFSIKLKTRIDEKGISYRFMPFHLSEKLIAWKDIKEAYVREYSPISDYGGWGMKGGKLWNKRKGIAYNISGNIGIQLVLQNGKKILIGTQEKNKVNSALQNYKNKLIGDSI